MTKNINDNKVSSDLLRGNTDTIILKLLIKQDMYGYEITKEIYELSGQLYELKEATMYSSLKRLEKSGNIVSYWGDESQGGRRKYYKITEDGLSTYKENLKNWIASKKILDLLIMEDKWIKR